MIYYAAADTALQSGLFLAIYRAIDDNNVNILSVSYSACEQDLGASGNLQVLNAWEQAVAQGIAVVVSTGDNGSAGCDDPDTVTAASRGLAVNGLASTPYDIAVGGTDFDVLGNDFSNYVAASNTTAPYTTALSYIPEKPWNDSSSTNGSLASNIRETNANIMAGSGGTSSAGNGGNSGYAKPAWQQQFSPSNSDSVRDLPDVSLLAGNGLYSAAWAVCEQSDCNDGIRSTIHAVGGTSAAAPAFAGMLALINQKVGASTRLGLANWVLYDLAAAAPNAFHQITTGNNSVACTSGSPGCGSNNFMTGYNAAAGYNLATGLGSVDVSNLIQAWDDDSRTAASTSLSLGQTTFTHGTPVSVSVAVSPSATGNVAIQTNYSSQATATGSVQPTSLALSAGTAAGTYSQFPGGSYNVYAAYAGDGSHSGSISQPVAVTVSPENSVVKFNVYYQNASGQLVNAAGATVPLGTVFSLNAQPIGVSQQNSSNPVTDATGSIAFADTYITYGGIPIDSSGLAEFNTASLQGGSHSFIASYSGDLSYNPSTSAVVTFRVAQVATSAAVTASSSTIISGAISLVAQITANVPVNSVQPTGTITFTDVTSNTVLGTAGPSSDCTGTNLCVDGVINVNSTQLVSGANSIVASYSGDSNFLASGNSPAITVTCQASCYNANGYSLGLSFGQMSPSTGTVPPGGSITANVGLSPYGGFTGNVNLTCSVAGASSTDQHIPTCVFNPAQVNVTNSNQAVISALTISTTAPPTSALNRRRSDNPFAAGAASLAFLAFLVLPAGRMRQRYLLAVIALLLAFSGLSACGGGGSAGGSGSSSASTTPDTYTVTFKATAASTGNITAENYFKFAVN